jgi:uncharacterized protein involved in cysteine biosynthesis
LEIQLVRGRAAFNELGREVIDRVFLILVELLVIIVQTFFLLFNDVNNVLGGSFTRAVEQRMEVCCFPKAPGYSEFIAD